MSFFRRKEEELERELERQKYLETLEGAVKNIPEIVSEGPYECWDRNIYLRWKFENEIEWRIWEGTYLNSVEKSIQLFTQEVNNLQKQFSKPLEERFSDYLRSKGF